MEEIWLHKEFFIYGAKNNHLINSFKVKIQK